MCAQLLMYVCVHAGHMLMSAVVLYHSPLSILRVGLQTNRLSSLAS